MTKLHLSLEVNKDSSNFTNRPISYVPLTNASVFNDSTSVTFDSGRRSCGNISVHDLDYNQKVRFSTLYITIILGTLGGICVIAWMWTNRRLKARLNNISRVNTFILNLTVADLMVMLLAVLPELVWEYQEEKEWIAGAFMCKLVKFLQSFTMMASTNMLVAIAIDRHQAIRSPLRTPMAVWKMTGAAWTIAVLSSLPMMYVFHLNESQDTPKCENIFRYKPMEHRQAFLTYISVMVFLIPFLALTICYVRIFLKIAEKSGGKPHAEKSMRESPKPGKIHLQSTPSSTLPKAKIKTLKMTFVIVMVYAVCGIPYFIGEMVMSYGDHCSISNLVYGLIGGLAPANSAANPYVFLLFNIKRNRNKRRNQQYSENTGLQRTENTGANRPISYSSNGARPEGQYGVKFKWHQRSKEKINMSEIKQV